MSAGFQAIPRRIAYDWIVGVGVTKIISVLAPLAFSRTSCDCGVVPPTRSYACSATTWLFTLAVPSADLKPLT